MTILVTGGAGYIGSHTCVKLLEKGYDIIVVDNYCNSSEKVLQRIKKLTGKDFKAYNADLREEHNLEQVFSENKIDAVIHFAGLKAVGESYKKPLEYYENNVLGAISLLKTMKKFGVKKIVFSSSATVYEGNVIPYVENMKTGNVSNPYGKTKYIVEEILKDIYNSDKQWRIMILRYFNPIGAHKSGMLGENPKGIPNNLMPYILDVATEKLPMLTVYGNDYPTHDGTCIRDYVHIEDLAEGHIKALQNIDFLDGVGIYNLGCGKGNSVLEIIKAFENKSGLKINYKIGNRRKGDLPEFYADVSKAKKELGWTVKNDINKMCEDAWRWRKQNPNGYEN
jgi:UDP-glucose 4-epimerase